MRCISWSFAWKWMNLVKQLRLLIIQLMCGNKLGYIWLIRSDTTVQYSSPDLKFGSPSQKLRDVSSSPRLKPAPQQSPVLPQGSSPIVREQQCKSESSFSSVVSSNGISPSNNQNETISTIVSPAENHVWEISASLSPSPSSTLTSELTLSGSQNTTIAAEHRNTSTLEWHPPVEYQSDLADESNDER